MKISFFSMNKFSSLLFGLFVASNIPLSEAACSYLTGGNTWTTTQGGSNPWTLNINLGQNWQFQADYNVHSLPIGPCNTIFGYGLYTDGILLRSLRTNPTDGFYVLGINYGYVDLFHDGASGTNGAFITVTISYTGAPYGTTNVYVSGVLEYSVTGNYPMTPATQQIRIGSALHNNAEGLDATIQNIYITTYDTGTSCPGTITVLPTTFPTYVPSSPTHRPTHPTYSPSTKPTTRNPTRGPTKKPTFLPSGQPTSPTLKPTGTPTLFTNYLAAFTTTQSITGPGVTQATLLSQAAQKAFVAAVHQLLNANYSSYVISVSILSVVPVNSGYGYVYNTIYIVPNGQNSKFVGVYQNLSTAITAVTTNNAVTSILNQTCKGSCGLPASLVIGFASFTAPAYIQTPTPSSAPSLQPVFSSIAPSTQKPTSPTLKPSLFPTSPTSNPVWKPTANPSFKPSRKPTLTPSIHSLAPTTQGQCFCNVRYCGIWHNKTTCVSGASPQVYH